MTEPSKSAAAPASVPASIRSADLANFHEELRQKNRVLFTWSAIIFNSVYLGWSAFDYFLAPDHWRTFFWLRLAAFTINSTLAVASHRGRVNRASTAVFWVWFFVFAAFVAPMLVTVENQFPLYALGATLVFFGAGLVPYWPPRWLLSNLGAQLFCCLAAFVIQRPAAAWGEVIGGLFFIVSAAAISAVMGSAKYFLLRSDYLTRIELREAQLVTEKLKAADRLKDEFLANVSHELRTPLHAIIGLSESILEGADGNVTPPQRRDLGMIASSGRRLSNLVNQILDFSKLRNEAVALSTRPLDLRSLCDVVAALLAPLVAEKQLTLVNGVAANLPPVLADEDRLQQILINLIGNAIKFTETGSIQLNAELHGKQVTLSVADTGIGIAADQQRLIFDSFQQGDASISRQHAGTGLGLAVSRKLVELHQSQLWVRSQLGQGATFGFTLPVAEGLPEAARPPAIERRSSVEPMLLDAGHDPQPDPARDALAEPTDQGLEAGAVVLVVDDEPINLQVISNLLGVRGYHLIRATCGLRALELLATGPRPALVLLDVMMPKMSGYEVLRQIRRQYSATELPVILLTAKTQAADLVEGFDCGANDYVTKPISRGELLSRIKTHLGIARMCTAYGRFVPAQFLKHLDRASITEVHLGDQVQKEMSVLFTDIRAFTSLSEQLTPHETFNFLNSLLHRIAPVLEQHGGFIDKYIGDAVMALFPGAVDDAVTAAANLRREIRTYNAHRKNSGYRPISLGTGLHTGPLILGTIGYKERLQTTVIADSVNLASRLEGLTKQFAIEVAVSDEALSRVAHRDRVQVRTLGKLSVRGKQQSVLVYELLDGAPEAELELRLSSRELFEAGVQHMVDRDFHAAGKAFGEVIRFDETDQTAGVFLRRCALLSEEPSAQPTPVSLDRRAP